jgi:hypothetical protein
MNIYCVNGVAAYHEYVCAMRAVCAAVPDGNSDMFRCSHTIFRELIIRAC